MYQGCTEGAPNNRMKLTRSEGGSPDAGAHSRASLELAAS
jgi:hypothetical protein